MRRIIAKSPQKDYDILKSLGDAKVQDIATDKIENISKQVYHEIESENLFSISSEPANIRAYINEVLREASMVNLDLLQKSKDKASAEDLR